MSVADPSHVAVRPAIHTITAALKDVRTLARQMVGHFLQTVFPWSALPHETVRGDLTDNTRLCLELAVTMLEESDTAELRPHLEAAAAGWARDGVSIDVVQHAVHEGAKLGFDLLVDEVASMDSHTVQLISRRLLEIVDMLTTTISRAYVGELEAVASQHHSATQTLTTALLAGQSSTTIARGCGIELSDSYQVLAIQIAADPQEQDRAMGSSIAARGTLRRLRSVLATRFGSSSLYLLSVQGGTILLPSDLIGFGDLDLLIDQLAQAAEAPLSAVVVSAGVDEIPEAAERAHATLDIVARLHGTPKLHYFDDLVLEYQLTRPGPARDQLATLLDPLDAYPDLLETLQCHIGNNLNRGKTARQLYTHVNTIDHRMRRIGDLVGLDTSPAGVWYMRAALVARSYRRHPGVQAPKYPYPDPRARTRSTLEMVEPTRVEKSRSAARKPL
ncbi:helix-turn-helix domain-containing protein [Nocardia sp. NPDC050435]|uniref:PucR family transcriptional regulator n=1 Tax=Nocardia sp. NPDC050435 TaxID=3155040 RepID=UPI0033DC5810